MQDFDPEVQRAVNREQSVEQTLDAIIACRDSGFRSVNLDLIYGLPKQTTTGSRARWTSSPRHVPIASRFMATPTLGVSAISHIGDTFSQNPRELPAWEIPIDRGQLHVWRGLALNSDDRLRADAIQQLMCHGVVDIAALEHRHEIVFDEYFAGALARLAPLIEDGLATRDERYISVTSRGRLLLRIIAMCFDNYLNAAEPAARPRYSRVI